MKVYIQEIEERTMELHTEVLIHNETLGVKGGAGCSSRSARTAITR